MFAHANPHFVILNLFQDNHRLHVVLKQVQHDENSGKFCSRGDAETQRLQAAEGRFSLLTSLFSTGLFEGASRKFALLLRASASPREHFIILRESA